MDEKTKRRTYEVLLHRIHPQPSKLALDLFLGKVVKNGGLDQLLVIVGDLEFVERVRHDGDVLEVFDVGVDVARQATGTRMYSRKKSAHTRM